MKLSGRVKSISYLKTHAAEVLRSLADEPGPVVITLHGEAKAVVQDVESYERTQETMALLKMLAMSAKSLEEGRLHPADEAFAGIRNRLKA